MDKVEKCMPEVGRYNDRANIRKYHELNLKQAAAKEKAAVREAVAARITESAAKKVNSSLAANRIVLDAYKRKAIGQITKLMPIAIMTEAFSAIVAKSLVHDETYVTEQMGSLKAFTFLYLYNLGGMKYLKEQYLDTKSGYLKKLYTICKEDAIEPTTDKITAIKNAKTIGDVKQQMNFEMEPEAADKVKDDIGTLNPDEVGELVKDKVLTAINDEAAKQEKDDAFRQELADKRAEYETGKEEGETEEPAGTDEAQTGTDNAPAPAEGQEEQPSSQPATGGEEITADSAQESYNAIDIMKRRSGIVKYLLRSDIHKLYEQSVLFAITNSVYKAMMHPVKEAYLSNVVVTTPLNMNMDEVYADNINGDLADIELCQTSNNAPITDDGQLPDDEDVLAEALLQYTFLEAATTIKLINPSRKDIQTFVKASMR